MERLNVNLAFLDFPNSSIRDQSHRSKIGSSQHSIHSRSQNQSNFITDPRKNQRLEGGQGVPCILVRFARTSHKSKPA